jgi:SNF2 family DNA or RNA helicase
LNAEQDALETAFSVDGVSIRGATPDDDRVPMLQSWLTGRKRVLISKPSVFGYGLNLQVCHNIAFVGLSDSWEQYYQAIRRCWRFGQTHQVECHIIASEAEGAVTANIQRKEKDSTERIEAMVEIMKAKTMEQLKQVQRQSADYIPVTEMILPSFFSVRSVL